MVAVAVLCNGNDNLQYIAFPKTESSLNVNLIQQKQRRIVRHIHFNQMCHFSRKKNIWKNMRLDIEMVEFTFCVDFCYKKPTYNVSFHINFFLFF